MVDLRYLCAGVLQRQRWRLCVPFFLTKKLGTVTSHAVVGVVVVQGGNGCAMAHSSVHGPPMNAAASNTPAAPTASQHSAGSTLAVQDHKQVGSFPAGHLPPRPRTTAAAALQQQCGRRAALGWPDRPWRRRNLLLDHRI